MPTTFRYFLGNLGLTCLTINLFILWSIPAVVQSQTCCSGGAPLAGTVGLNSGNKGLFEIQTSLDVNRLETLINVSERLEDRFRVRNTVSFLLESSYAISDHWSVQALGSFLQQDRRVTTIFGGESFVSNSGIGDMMVLLLYQQKYEQMSWRLGAGPVIPSGKIDAKSTDGLILSPDLQPGSGAWDLLTWAQVQVNPYNESPAYFLLRSSYRHTGESQRLNGQQAYQFGKEFQFWTGYSGWVRIKRQQFYPQLNLRYRFQSPDKVNQSIFNNTGGHWLFLRPTLQWQLLPSITLTAYGEVPVWERLIGTQLSTTYRMGVGVNWAFQTIREAIDIGL